MYWFLMVSVTETFATVLAANKSFVGTEEASLFQDETLIGINYARKIVMGHNHGTGENKNG